MKLTKVNASSVHVRPATRADLPGIVWASNSSTLPNEDVGFGGSMNSPFRDVSALAAPGGSPISSEVKRYGLPKWTSASSAA
jgi:hypothetical protein